VSVETRTVFGFCFLHSCSAGCVAEDFILFQLIMCDFPLQVDSGRGIICTNWIEPEAEDHFKAVCILCHLDCTSKPVCIYLYWSKDAYFTCYS